MISRKKRGDCWRPASGVKERDVVQHIGDDTAPEKQHRRVGYKYSAWTPNFTINECAENGFSSKVPVKSEIPSKLMVSNDGERTYTICGAEDMRKPATRNFVKSELPASARLHRHNERTDTTCQLEFQDLKVDEPRCDRLRESTGMWGCLNYSSRRQWEPPEVARPLPPRTPAWMLNLRHEPDECDYAVSCCDVLRKADIASDYAECLGTSPARQELPTPSGSEVGFRDAQAQLSRLQRCSSAPTSRSSTATGESRCSRGSLVSSGSFTSRGSCPRGAGTRGGSDTPGRSAWR